MRVVGTGYHATDEKRGGFFFSEDRGKSWRGPYHLGDLADLEQFEGRELTPRTDYIVGGPNDCLVFLSARNPKIWGSDRVFCVRTRDAGKTFQFVSWVVPLSDPFRAVMPSTVRCSARRLVSAIRRREIDTENCWVDTYVSDDDGQNWFFLSKVGVTGRHNGNPPALLRLQDGRLCCVYGNRTKRRIMARLSDDEGASWSEEMTLRDDYRSLENDADLGYPRLVQRKDGRLVVIYYWATREHPHQYIAATIWDPGGKGPFPVRSK
jgi:hypothetical protein